MDPSHQWQQPPQGGSYGPSPVPPQSGPPYFGQPVSGQPVQGQPQQPYTTQSYPAQQYPPQQQYPAQQYPPQPYQAPQPYSGPPAQAYTGPPAQSYSAPPARRNRWFAALVIAAVLLVVMAVSVVVVALTRDSGDQAAPGGTGSASPAGPVDSCLVGKWKQTSYQKSVELADTDVGTREKLGTIKMNGGGKVWTINADGSAIEDDSKTVYSGKDAGRTVTATFSGTTTWTLKTTPDLQIQFAGKESDAVVVISVDGADKGRIELEPNTDPAKYTCTGDIWRTTSLSDPDSFSRYDRVK